MDLKRIAETALSAIASPFDADDHEGAHLDFKETPDLKDGRAREKFSKDLAESVVCFANGLGGGVLLVGVKDKASTRDEAIVGVDTVRWSLQDMVSRIHARTSPSITVQSCAVEVDGRIIYALGVPEGRDVYSTTEGVYKIRLQDRCVALEGDQLRGLRTVRQGHDWSAEAIDVGWSELSRAALERGHDLLSRHGNDELAGLALRDVAAFGRSAGIATPDGAPTRAAVLLYGAPSTLAKITEWGVNV